MADDARFKLIRDQDGLYWLLDESAHRLHDGKEWLTVEPLPEHEVTAEMTLGQFKVFVGHTER